MVAGHGYGLTWKKIPPSSHKNTSWRVCKESHSFLSSNLTFPFTIVPGQKQKRSGGEVCVHSSQPRYLSHMKIHELESLKRSGHPATPHRWPWVRTAEASENPHCIRINNCREMKISSNITMILSMDHDSDHDPWTLDHGPWCMTPWPNLKNLLKTSFFTIDHSLSTKRSIQVIPMDKPTQSKVDELRKCSRANIKYNIN